MEAWEPIEGNVKEEGGLPFFFRNSNEQKEAEVFMQEEVKGANRIARQILVSLSQLSFYLLSKIQSLFQPS